MDNIAAQNFTFRELAIATNNFRPESLLGDGGFGRVYKGQLKNNNQVILFSVYWFPRVYIPLETSFENTN